MRNVVAALILACAGFGGFGHVIENTRENIAQHGRTGAAERVVLENMLSNGYEGWLWDGWAQAGGWAESGERDSANEAAGRSAGIG